MPTPRRCCGCGAALGEPTDDDLTIVCRFCGLRHDINQLADVAAPVVAPLGRPLRGAARAIIAIILFMVAVSVAIAIFVAYRAADMATTFTQDTVAAARAREAERTRPLALAELGSVTEYAWKKVETVPPPWGMTIARAWASDGVLTRIDVGRVTTTGIVDVSGDIPSDAVAAVRRGWSSGARARQPRAPRGSPLGRSWVAAHPPGSGRARPRGRTSA